MALNLRSPALSQKTVKKSPCSRPRTRLTCKAVLNLEPKQAFVDAAHKRDVSAKAALAVEEALVLPVPSDVIEQPQPVSAPAQLDAIVAHTIKVPCNAYSNALSQYPLATKACTSMVGFILGDLVAQHCGHPHAAVDMLRMLHLAVYGLCIDGPLGSMWYDVLEEHVFPDEPLSNKAVLAKTALDQVVYATIMTGVFFAVIRCLEGHPEAIMSTLQSKFVPTLAANYMIWPLAHLINFRFVPGQYRILYNNVVSIAWLTGLSYITHSKVNLLQLLHLPQLHLPHL